MTESEREEYIEIGHSWGLFFGVMTGAIIWTACIVFWGGLGFALGWLPGGFVGIITYALARFVWPLFLIAVLVGLIALSSHAVYGA